MEGERGKLLEGKGKEREFDGGRGNLREGEVI